MRCVSCAARWLTTLLTTEARNEGKARQLERLPPEKHAELEAAIAKWWPLQRAAARARARRYLES